MRILVRCSVLVCLLAAACGSGGDDRSAAPPSEAATSDGSVAPTSPPSAAARVPTQTSATATVPPPGATVDSEAQTALDAITDFVAIDLAEDGPFYMVNLIKYRDEAVYYDGRPTDLTGREAEAVYGEWMRTEMLPAMGAEIVYVGQVEGDLVGGSDFDTVAVVRYPSRAELLAMVNRADFQDMLVHKDAGVADTTVLATSIQDLPEMPPVGEPPFPPSADDPSFAFVHVLDYRDTAEYADGDVDADPRRSGRDAVALYSQNAGKVAGPLGVRAVAWFDVDAVIRGDEDGWEEVRINSFPSHATFTELTSDPRWQAGLHHREAGLERTYAIQTLPLVNRFSS